jgi:RNA polymerase sigma-70 factor (ECF subfamily)
MVPADVDAPLVERVQRGDMRAFEMLVVKYQRRIERLIARTVRDPDSVADIAQETFVRAWRALPGFRGESAFYTWLYRIAVNTARKSLAQQLREPMVSGSPGTEIETEEGTFPAGVEPSHQDTPDAWLASREIAQAVNEAVEALSEELRQAIVLREIEGLGYEEMAAVMNCPIGTVRSRLFRAREAVAERLRPLRDASPGRRW